MRDHSSDAEILGDFYEGVQNVTEGRLAQACWVGATAIRALKLIADSGGKTNDELGLSMNGSWCAEQARRALDCSPSSAGEKP